MFGLWYHVITWKIPFGSDNHNNIYIYICENFAHQPTTNSIRLANYIFQIHE